MAAIRLHQTTKSRSVAADRQTLPGNRMSKIFISFNPHFNYPLVVRAALSLRVPPGSEGSASNDGN